MGLANKIPVPDFVGNPEKSTPDAAGIYVHVPFCSHACDFCAFYQVEPRRDDIDRYLKTIADEFALVPAERSATAFWGGGTPGLLPARDLERLAAAQIARFGVPDQEWSVELAPGSVRADKLRVLRDAGVTRVSLGVQSFSPATLEALGRRHSLEQVREAWRLIEAAGFPSRNIDLIFAVPGQTPEAWAADLDAAAATGADHISTYCLTFEEDTALFVRLSQGKVKLDVERERAFYETTWDRLAAHGFAQYEISNHARPGYACRHNLNTWRMGRWHGFGPSAASQERDWRGANVADLAQWCEDVAQGRRGETDRTSLDAAQLAEDALIFGLRMNEGVSLVALRARFGPRAVAPFEPVLRGLAGDGLVELRDGEVLALTRAGRLVADAVGAELLGLAHPAPS
jgi:oxygen-independent coproporphyrinogen-3 oxidase